MPFFLLFLPGLPVQAQAHGHGEHAKIERPSVIKVKVELILDLKIGFKNRI